MSHKVYKSIVNAIKSGRLREPFTSQDFKSACQDLVKAHTTHFYTNIDREIPEKIVNCLNLLVQAPLNALDLSSMVSDNWFQSVSGQNITTFDGLMITQMAENRCGSR